MDNRIPCPQCEAIIKVALAYKHGDADKAAQWLLAEHPELGASPLQLMRDGEHQRVLTWVVDASKAELAALEAKRDALLAELAARQAAQLARQECDLLCAWKGGGHCLRDDCPRRVAR